MNPIILSTFDLSGGAARAAFRLHQGLKGSILILECWFNTKPVMKKISLEQTIN